MKRLLAEIVCGSAALGVFNVFLGLLVLGVGLFWIIIR